MPSSMPVPNAPDSTMSDVAVWLGENYPTVDVKAALELYAPDAKHLDPCANRPLPLPVVSNLHHAA